MKKLLYTLLALATALTAASCAKELEGNIVADGGSATITLSVSLGPQTKAIADGTQANKLYAGLYQIGAGPTFTHITHTADPVAITSKSASVTFEGQIHRGNDYRVVLWAQEEGAPYTIDWATTATTGPTVTVTTYTGNTNLANDDTRDAFYGFFDATNVQGAVNADVQLKRPFAQVNVLVPKGNIDDLSAEVTSSMTITNAPTVLNLATKATTSPENWAFASAVMTGDAFGNYSDTHKYIAMNYVLVDQAGATTYDVTFSATSASTTTPQTVENRLVEDLPMKPNSRTNITGDIFTSNDFDITIGIGISPDPDKVETPTFSVPAGTYNTVQSVELACATVGATIYYTLDGTAPSNTSTQYTDAIAVNSTTTIKAIAVKGGMTDSDVATAAYTITLPPAQVATPTFSPSGTWDTDHYTTDVEVTINCTTEDASIYYTLDGTAPTSGSILYSAPFTITETKTIKAIAVKEGWTDSEIATAAYTINIPEEPDFTTVAGLKALLGAESATLSGTLTDAVVSFVAGTSDAVIKDATGSILYHKESGHDLLQGQTISGDVIVDGVVYNGVNEITDLAATVEGTGSAVEPQVVTLAQLAADYATYESAYVKVVGVTSKTTTTAKGNISVTQDATDYIVYTNVAIPVNTGDIFTAEGTVTKYNMTEELKVWKSADLTVTTAAPVLSATPATTTVAATATSVTWNITSNTDWTITPGTGVTPSATAGNGNAEVTLSFAANEGTEAATYTATVSAEGCEDVTITITQSEVGASSYSAIPAGDLTLNAGMSGTVNGIAGYKLGTTSAAQTVTIAAGYTSISVYAAGWASGTNTMTITNGTIGASASATLTNDAGISGNINNNFALTSITGESYEITVTDSESPVVISIKRGVIWDFQGIK